MSDRVTTRAIKDALALRFAAPEWACFFEVASGTGAQAGRSADALAMNMFPSRGLRVHGVEVKASRSDWLRELKNPAKAEAIQRYCDHWWIAAPAGLVKPEELPPTWGLLELNGKTLRQRVAAPVLDAEPMGRPFIASLLRSASGAAARDLHNQVAKATEVERASVAERVKREVDWATRAHRDLQEKVREFEEESGLTIAKGWHGGKEVGRAVRLVQSIGLTSLYGGVRGMAEQARKLANSVEEALASLPDDEVEAAA